jgi:P4 family phage/plasmid primase-like protien
LKPWKPPRASPDELACARPANPLELRPLAMNATPIAVYLEGLKAPSGTEPLSEIIETIRTSPELEKAIGEIRAEPDKDRRAQRKRKLPAMQASASQAGAGRVVIEHSGLVQLDIDHIGAAAAAKLRDTLEYDPHTAAAFVSPSGDGLKVLLAIPADLDGHEKAYEAAMAYARDQWKFNPDSSCRDPKRLCFLSHDPEAWCKHANPLDVDKWAPAPEEPPAAPPPQAPAAAPETSGALSTDADRARAFVARWRDEILFVNDRRVWLTWEGRWKKDCSGGFVRRSMRLFDETMAALAALPTASKADAQAKNHALTCAAHLADARKIQSMRAMAEAALEIQCAAADLDADPWQLGTPNGVVDLRTGEGREHHPADRITMATRAPFDPEATAPRWLQFIEEIFPDEELRRYVWKALGYALTGSTREKCFHFLIGTGDNGKSVLCEILMHVLGDYAGTAPKGLLCAADRGGYPLREAAAIVGKRFIVGPETEERDRINTGLLKRLTGNGDSLEGAALYENQFSFVPVAKLFIMGNHKPGISDTGPAMWKRVRLIPFERQFKDAEQDKGLAGKLRAEASGILNWLIQGALLWQAEGLETPSKVIAATEDYRAEQDTLADFIEECTEPDPNASTPHARLFKIYETWCEESGIRFKTTKKGLAKRLREKGWEVGSRTAESFTNWKGIALRNDANDAN